MVCKCILNDVENDIHLDINGNAHFTFIGVRYE